MLDVAFIFIFCAFPILVFIYLKFLKINFLELSVLNYLLLCFFVFGYIGTLPLYFYWDEYRASIGIVDKNLIFSILLCSITSVALFLGGFTLCLKKFKKYNFFVFKKIAQISKKDFILLISLLFFCCLILFLYLSKVPYIAIFVALFGDGSVNVDFARSSMGNNFQGGNYNLYKVIFSDLLKIVVFSLFGAFLLEFHRKKLLFTTFICAFVVCAFVCVMDGQKAPTVWFVLGLFFVYILIRLKSRLSPKLVIFACLMSIFILVATFACFVAYKYDSVVYILRDIISRATAGSIQAAYFYLKYFPQYHDFLLGASFFNPLDILPYTRFNLPVEIYNWVFPDNFEKLGMVGSMPMIFWGEAYANFGFLGVATVSFLMGILIYMECFLIDKIKNTPLKVGFCVWFIFHVAELSISGFSRILIDYYLIIIIFILVISKYLINKAKIGDWR